jgi:hypothetical protein
MLGRPGTEDLTVNPGVGPANENENYDSDADYSGSHGSLLSPSENYDDPQNDILSAEEDLNRGGNVLSPDSEGNATDDSFG